MDNFKLLRFIYIAYFFFLPLGTFVQLPSNDGVWNLFEGMSRDIMLFGCMLIFLNNYRLKTNNSIKAFKYIYLFMVIYSFCAATVLSMTPLELYRTPYRAIIGDILLYLEVLLSIYFNYFCLTRVINIDEVLKLVKYQIILIISFGFFQFLALIGNSMAVPIYKSMSSFQIIPYPPVST